MKGTLAVAYWTIKARRWSIFWWCLGVSAFIAINLAFYPTFRDQATQLNQVLNHLPATTRALFSDTGNFLTPGGFLSARLFYLMLPLILSILAIGLGSSLLAKEEADGTIELLLSRPLSRGRLLLGKGLAGLIILAVVGGFALGVTLAISWLVKIEVPLGRIATAAGLAAVLALLFGAIAFTVTAFGRTARLASVGLAALVGLGSYIVASLAETVGWLKWPAKLMPHHYYHPSEILAGYFSWWKVVGVLVLVLAMGLIGWLAFRRRDLG